MTTGERVAEFFTRYFDETEGSSAGEPGPREYDVFDDKVRRLLGEPDGWQSEQSVCFLKIPMAGEVKKPPAPPEAGRQTK